MRKVVIASFFACQCFSGQTAREVQPELPTTAEPRSDESTATQEVRREERRGAAKRVVEGESSAPRKSAAQLAMETEMALHE